MSDNTVIDRIFALVSVLVLAVYLGVLVWYVPQPALTAVCVLTVVLAGYDFYRMAVLGKN